MPAEAIADLDTPEIWTTTRQLDAIVALAYEMHSQWKRELCTGDIPDQPSTQRANTPWFAEYETTFMGERVIIDNRSMSVYLVHNQ